ncbi:helix-turn-helix domain-containing protein [Maribacter sp. MMG018]|uniref:helix-turn-helix domain-containing protein n=1 Tax=Maribacter sp. MMG018 TaxID=2822688 RepID=UPI001B376D41|nr:helix-turn-helix domain-containing protein [Maribacter sp. MMG018]MBQ4913934.1 helix-turn-helix domain-containing protein [Maribacter sp. MMG018]
MSTLFYSTAFSQEKKGDSINDYFNRIEKLVTDIKSADEYPKQDILLKRNENTYGTEKVDVLLELCHLNKYKSIKVAENYNKKAFDLSNDINYLKGIYSATYNHAYLQFIQGDFNRAMTVIKSLEKRINYKRFPKNYADVQTLKSDIHTEKGEYDKALETGLKLLDIGENIQNEYILMKSHAALSHYYLRTKNYKKALEHCLLELDFIIDQKNVHYIFQKVDEIARMTAKLGDTKTSLKAYAFYLKIEKELYSPGSYIQSIVYMNMADLHMAIGEFEKAQNYLTQALTLNNENNYRFRIPRALTLQSELYLKTKDTLNAISTYEKSIEAAENINAFDVIKTNSQILIDLYEKTNQPSKVNEYKALHEAIRDSLFNNEKEQQIIILETRRKIKEATQKQQALELENLAQRSKLTTIIAILGSILVIGFFFVLSYVKIKEKNKVLYRRTIENLETQLKTEDKKLPLKTKSKSTKEKTNPTIDDNVKTIILNRLEKLENENFFIDSDCNLHQLAEKLKTNPKYLSQVINVEKGSNFNNYINELRINFLLTKLVQDEEFRNSKLSYIASSVGYNNLNTFNAAFKKRQGILPSFFIKQLNEES